MLLNSILEMDWTIYKLGVLKVAKAQTFRFINLVSN